jgi:acyl-CoA synthetase (AMP-forming)/AMP-acid ligase II
LLNKALVLPGAVLLRNVTSAVIERFFCSIFGVFCLGAVIHCLGETQYTSHYKLILSNCRNQYELDEARRYVS